jgi:uncharacterized protein YlxP (DUF503 family)
MKRSYGHEDDVEMNGIQEMFHGHVGVLFADLHLPQAHSLKEKRSIVKKILQRGIKRYSFSGSEIDYQSKVQRTVLGFAFISGEISYIQSQLGMFEDELRRDYEENILSITLNII